MHQLPDSAELPTWSVSREATPVSRPQSPRMYHSSCMHPCWGSCSLPDHRCRITKDPIKRMHAEQPPLQAQGTPVTISTGRGPCIEGCAPLRLGYGGAADRLPCSTRQERCPEQQPLPWGHPGSTGGVVCSVYIKRSKYSRI